MCFFYLYVVAFRDAKCGKIQCQGGANRPVIGTNAVSIETNIPLQEGGRILCRGTHVYLGDDMPDPGLVLAGTMCGDGLVRDKFRLEHRVLLHLQDKHRGSVVVYCPINAGCSHICPVAIPKKWQWYNNTVVLLCVLMANGTTVQCQ